MKKNKTLWHFGKKSAGQTLKWLPTDTEESFQQLVQNEEYQEYFRSKGWLEPDAITYRINSAGFRSEEFDPQANSMVSLGCSYTIELFGIAGSGLEKLQSSLGRYQCRYLFYAG